MRDDLPVTVRLAGLLGRWRAAAGLDLGDAAKVIDMDRSAVSRIESGDRGIRPAHLRLLLAEYGVDRQVEDALVTVLHCAREGWWSEQPAALTAAGREQAALEMAASRIRVYEPLRPPELLMSARHAEALGPGPGTRQGELHAWAVSARQAAVLGRRPPPEVSILIGTAATQAAAELDPAWLPGLASTPAGASARFVPPGAGALRAAAGPFTIMQVGPDGPGISVVSLPAAAGSVLIDNDEAVSACEQAFASLAAAAVTIADAAAARSPRNATAAARPRELGQDDPSFPAAAFLAPPAAGTARTSPPPRAGLRPGHRDSRR